MLWYLVGVLAWLAVVWFACRLCALNGPDRVTNGDDR